MACVTDTSFKFLVSCYRERDRNVRRGEGASSLFSRHARVSSKSPFALKKKEKIRRLLKAGYKGQRNNDKASLY